ncbi:hypothetical protein NC99_12970 [Sunxiuqinia dokdonensis]|uniref:Uncharacterized protein n=1 Tax=Sunxiuqinia dokdonensis TaxID=1409788 RepID=A0A0L8VBK1_9BACT|nr:hypothetical protein NC99_12970 [Sunxiuqinia dokdonensis]
MGIVSVNYKKIFRFSKCPWLFLLQNMAFLKNVPDFYCFVGV